MKKFVVFVLMALTTFLLVSCGDVVLENITIDTLPTKVTYLAGESFDATGMVVKANYSDNKSEVITDYTVDKTTLKVGDTVVTITYEGKTAMVTITVNEVQLTKIEVTTPPTKVAYFVGDEFDSTGMVVKGTYEDGKVEVITSYQVDKTVLSLDDSKVTVSFGGKTATVNLTVSRVKFVENFDSYGETEPVTGLADSKAFKIAVEGDNGFLQSVISEWGGSPWYGEDIGKYKLVDDYSVSFDFMYPEGVYGIGAFQLKGIIGDGDYEICGIHLHEDGRVLLYANRDGGQLYNSEDPTYGGTGNEWTVEQGTWHNLNLVKRDNVLFVYVDDVLVVHTVANFNFTELKGVAFIQFLLDETIGICYDNLVIEQLESVSSSVEISAENKIVENFNSYESGDAMLGFADTPSFKITKVDENGYLESVVSEWGGSPWYGQDVNDLDLEENYSISFDFMYLDGVYGIGALLVDGFANNEAYEIVGIELNGEGASLLYSNKPGGQLYNTNDIFNGGTGNEFEIVNGEWNNLRLNKIGNTLLIYVNDVLVLKKVAYMDYTKITGIAFVQFLFDGTVGICYDNLTISEIVVK